MRLDHLLSKEQLAGSLRASCPCAVSRAFVSGQHGSFSGTSTIWWRPSRTQVSTTGLRTGREIRSPRSPPSGTLLGPEGSSASAPFLRTCPSFERPAARGYAMYRARYRPYLESCIVDASIFVAILLMKERQATKGTWWMPWHQEPKKDVGVCDKPREVDNRAVIRGCPNGETQLELCPVTVA